MADYLDPEVIAKAQALGVKARTLVEGLRVGDHKSPHRGFSVEFVQHREYVPGDDIRHIYWKGYARSDRYTIKQYEQETNFTAHLMVDASNSMLYGDKDSNKFEFAKTLTAALAYLIVQQRDSVALDVFDVDWRDRLPASGQMGHVQTILNTLVSVKPRDKTTMGPLLHDIANQVRRRCLFFLISDCFDDVQSVLGGLQHLRFGGHEVIVFHILHPDEIDFPFNGMVKFDAMEEKMHLLTRPQLVRPTYLRALKKYLEELQQGCEHDRCDYVLVNTGRPLVETLTEYLARRLRTRVV
jgi:uncharacterized protein (DUF58 family)